MKECDIFPYRVKVEENGQPDLFFPRLVQKLRCQKQSQRVNENESQNSSDGCSTSSSSPNSNSRVQLLRQNLGDISIMEIPEGEDDGEYLFISDLVLIKREIETLSTEKKRLLSEISTLNRTIFERDESLAEAKQRTSELETELVTKNEKLEEVQRDREHLKQLLKEADEQRQTLKNRFYQDKFLKTVHQKADVEFQLSIAQAKAYGLQEENGKLQNRVLELEQRLFGERSMSPPTCNNLSQNQSQIQIQHPGQGQGQLQGQRSDSNTLQFFANGLDEEMSPCGLQWTPSTSNFNLQPNRPNWNSNWNASAASNSNSNSRQKQQAPSRPKQLYTGRKGHEVNLKQKPRSSGKSQKVKVKIEPDLQLQRKFLKLADPKGRTRRAKTIPNILIDDEDQNTNESDPGGNFSTIQTTSRSNAQVNPTHQSPTITMTTQNKRPVSPIRFPEQNDHDNENENEPLKSSARPRVNSNPDPNLDFHKDPNSSPISNQFEFHLQVQVQNSNGNLNEDENETEFQQPLVYIGN